jgi:glycosyltransferase involved in cell wall biosynthesis
MTPRQGNETQSASQSSNQLAGLSTWRNGKSGQTAPANVGSFVSRPRSIVVISTRAHALFNFRKSLICELVGKGFMVYALAPDYDDHTSQCVEALGAIPLKYSLSSTGTNPLRDLLDIISLWRLLKKLSPEIFLASFIKPVIYGSIAAWGAGVQKIFSMIEGLGYVFIENSHKGLPQRILRSLSLKLYRLSLALNRRVFFLNEDDSCFFLKKRLVAEYQAIRIDGIGVDLDFFSLAPPSISPITFIFVGRLLREKGIHEFVGAAKIIRAQHEHIRFVIVGSTDINPGSIEESEIRDWVDAGILDWAGQVDDVRPWIASASVFVLPSYREGLPRSTQEAMAMGRPIITTDAVGCRETVVDDVNGWCVPVGDIEGLANVMLRFILQPELIARMGMQSRRIAERRFNVHEINRQIISELLA